ncbi:MAG: hypothetical protein ACI4KR_01400 [Ruminiclostridium sp.]
MKRHPEYEYEIGKKDPESSWIYIKDKNESGWEKLLFDYSQEDNFAGQVEFLLHIKEKYNWNIEEAEPFGYQFVEDNLKMVFHWDDLFGFTVSVEDWQKSDKVLNFLREFTNE